MTLQEIKKILDKTGLPVAYSHFETETDFPVIVYMESGSNNFSADNYVYHKARAIRIELYTTKKEPKTEEKLEKVLDEAEIFYDKTEIYIDSEKLFEIIYECEV